MADTHPYSFRFRRLLATVFCVTLTSAAALADIGNPTDAELTSESQLSYRAEGGFTSVADYSVILSCVKGHVSIMKSISDPRFPEETRLRRLGTMPADRYLALWRELERLNVLKTGDGAPLTQDIADEFTVHFNAKVGDFVHGFQVEGISRPESSRYFAIQRAIDTAVNMDELWSVYHGLAQALPMDDQEP